MDERRSEERFPVSLDAIWDGTASQAVRIVDLSEGGCFVDAIREGHIGEPVMLRIQLPDGVSLELKGEVAHQMQTVGFGVRFVNLSDEQTEQLRSFIAYLRGPHDPVTALLR